MNSFFQICKIHTLTFKFQELLNKMLDLNDYAKVSKTNSNKRREMSYELWENEEQGEINVLVDCNH